MFIEIIFRNTTRRLNSQQQCVGDPEKILKQSEDRLCKSIYADLFLIFLSNVGRDCLSYSQGDIIEFFLKYAFFDACKSFHCLGNCSA